MYHADTNIIVQYINLSNSNKSTIFFVNRKVGDIYAVVGTHSLVGSGSAYEVSHVFPHRAFNTTLLTNDIGLVKLVKPLKYTEYIQPIGLPTTDHVPKSYFGVVSGWGNVDVSCNYI